MRRLAIVLAALLWAAPAGATVTVNVANAPGWQSSHSYALKDRVVAGAGWNGTAYTSGSCLAVFAVTVGGTGGSDPTVFNTACASGTPAGVGGGLDGSVPAGWGSASTVTDGGVTWALLAVVDYVTFTGFACDENRTWAQSTTYTLLAVVINAGHCYNSISDPDCVSSGSGGGPTGTTFNSFITDGTCQWNYQGDVTYTSGAHRLPHQLSILGTARYQMQYADNYVVNLIYGGTQRQSYKPGANGELSPLQSHYHADMINDAEVRCLNDSSLDNFDCLGANTGLTYTVTYQCFSGDCWYNNVAPGTTPLWYDVTKGVNIFNDDAQGSNGAGSGLNLGDSNTKLSGLQIVSMHSAALWTTPASLYVTGPTNTNLVWLDRSIVVGGDNAVVAFSCDLGCNISNSLVASRSTVAGSVALSLKYQGVIFNSTIACKPGVTNSTGVTLFWVQTNPPSVPWKNDTIIGCTNPFAYDLTPPGTTVDGADNATDVASAPTNTFTDALYGATYTAAAFPGTTLSGITIANQFQNPVLTAGADWRIKNTSADIYGAGAAFTYATGGCGLCMTWMGTITAASLDIYQTSRPVSSRYDLGAAEFLAGGPVASVKGGKIRGGLWH
jgi:hypothetical protein